MPHDCVAPGCDLGRTFKGKRALFSFPKDPEIRNYWLRKISQKDFIPTKHSGVCEIHFEEKFVEKEHRVLRPDGTVLTCKRDKPRLTKDAVPTLFPPLFVVSDIRGRPVNVPRYASKSQPKKGQIHRNVNGKRKSVN